MSCDAVVESYYNLKRGVSVHPATRPTKQNAGFPLRPFGRIVGCARYASGSATAEGSESTEIIRWSVNY